MEIEDEGESGGEAAPGRWRVPDDCAAAQWGLWTAALLLPKLTWGKKEGQKRLVADLPAPGSLSRVRLPPPDSRSLLLEGALGQADGAAQSLVALQRELDEAQRESAAAQVAMGAAIGTDRSKMNAAEGVAAAANGRVLAAREAVAGAGALRDWAARADSLRATVASLRDAPARASEPVEATFWALPELCHIGAKPTCCERCGQSAFLSTVGIRRREYAAGEGVGLLYGQLVRCNNPARPDDGGPKSYCSEFKSWDEKARPPPIFMFYLY